jgi:hypothetical protein
MKLRYILRGFGFIDCWCFSSPILLCMSTISHNSEILRYLRLVAFSCVVICTRRDALVTSVEKPPSQPPYQLQLRQSVQKHYLGEDASEDDLFARTQRKLWQNKHKKSAEVGKHR